MPKFDPVDSDSVGFESSAAADGVADNRESKRTTLVSRGESSRDKAAFLGKRTAREAVEKVEAGVAAMIDAVM